MYEANEFLQDIQEAFFFLSEIGFHKTAAALVEEVFDHFEHLDEGRLVTVSHVDGLASAPAETIDSFRAELQFLMMQFTGDLDGQELSRLRALSQSDPEEFRTLAMQSSAAWQKRMTSAE